MKFFRCTVVVWTLICMVQPLCAQVQVPEVKLKTPKAPKIKLDVKDWAKGQEDVLQPEISRPPANLFDTLQWQLWQEGTLILSDTLIPLADSILPPPPEQTLLVRQDIRVSARKEPVNFEASLEKGDSLFFRVQNLAPVKLRQVRLLEGDVVVFDAGDISRKGPLESYYVATDAGRFTLQLVNGQFFSLPVSVNMTLHKRQMEILKETLTDTLWQELEETWMAMDTTVEIFTDQTLNLSPRRDITKPPYLRLLWDFPKDGNILGWAYWIGVGRQAIQKYDQIRIQHSAGVEPLEWFARNPRNTLPGHSQSQVDIILCTGKNCERAERNQTFRAFPLETLPGSKLNYALVRGMPDEFRRNPLFTLLRNTSDLYDYPVRVIGLVLLGNPIELTKKVRRFELKNSLQLSLQ